MGEGRIVQDPDILVGKPTIRGTRISVELILDLLAGDLDAAKIVEAYPHITSEDVKACLEYARAVIAQEVAPQPWPAASRFG